MKTRSLLLIIGLSAVGIAGVLFLTLFAPILRSADKKYMLPDTSDSGGKYEEQNIQNASAVEITADNVQYVIASLRRPEEYSRVVAIEVFWGETGNASYNLSVAVSGNMTSIRNNAAGKTTVIRDNRVYIKYDGEAGSLIMPQQEKDADEYQMLPTYEDILSLDRSMIISADFISDDISGEPLIFIYTQTGELKYYTDYVVSVRLGLIVSAVIRDGDTIVRRITTGVCERTAPDPALFTV